MLVALMLITTGVAGEPKLNNDFTSLYARLIERNEPDLVGFYEKRHARGDA